MRTRAQIIIKDGYGELWFYRHSDGYPEGTMPTLEKFLSWVKEGRIRDNVDQSAGWLIMIGAKENGYDIDYLSKTFEKIEKPAQKIMEPGHDIHLNGWKVGSYEPCRPVLHGDIEYLYTIDLKDKTITIKEI